MVKRVMKLYSKKRIWSRFSRCLTVPFLIVGTLVATASQASADLNVGRFVYLSGAPVDASGIPVTHSFPDWYSIPNPHAGAPDAPQYLTIWTQMITAVGPAAYTVDGWVFGVCDGYPEFPNGNYVIDFNVGGQVSGFDGCRLGDSVNPQVPSEFTIQSGLSTIDLVWNFQDQNTFPILADPINFSIRALYPNGSKLVNQRIPIVMDMSVPESWSGLPLTKFETVCLTDSDGICSFDVPPGITLGIGDATFSNIGLSGGASATGNQVILPETSPDAPTVSAPTRSASGQLTWNWSPNNTGGSPITSYAWSGACSGSGNVTTITCSNLTGGSTYTLTVSATNAVGTSDTSSSSLVATSVPDAPTVSAPTRSASGQLTWNWSPNNTGGSPITSYAWSGACSGSGNVTTITCSNLTGGSTYTLTVSATNAVGTSDTSSSSLVAYTVPSAPTGLASQSGTGRSVTLSWTAPSQTGGAPILRYTVTASPSGRSCTSTGTSCSVTGLTNGQSYTFTVVATNAIGDSAASQPSASATPWSAPANFGQPSVVPGSGQLTVTWTSPRDTGGFPITGYTATASPGGKICSTSGLTCTITGLDQSTPYSVQVVATNSKGLSSQSAPSIQAYAVSATSLKVKTIPFVVQVKSPFSVLAYGAPTGNLVIIGIPGSQGSCTTNAVGQCTATLSVKNPGSYTALAVLGKQNASSSFYAPSVTIPLEAKHGKSFSIAISNAPAKSQILITLSDGRTKVATTSGAGAASISIPVTKVGFLVVTPSVAGVNLKSSTVLVS